ncbi:hypothetical protein vseg_007152 [Gypsophila vaccaria]
MEFKLEDIQALLSQTPVGGVDAFGDIFLRRIPANNGYGLKETEVAIRVSQRRGGDQKEICHLEFKNELKLCFLKHPNIIGLIGFCEAKENFYLVYEIFQAKPLSQLVEGLTWKHALKILKGTVSALVYLHGHPDGPFVHSNISMNNVLVTEDFVPKLIDFRHCVLEGQRSINSSPKYYPSKPEGKATVQADVFAFGLLALQLITKDSRTAFAVEEGEGQPISLHHILDLYVPMLKERRNLVHASYGQVKESGKLTEMIFSCLKKDSQVDLKSFHRDLILLSLAKRC